MTMRSWRHVALLAVGLSLAVQLGWSQAAGPLSGRATPPAKPAANPLLENGQRLTDYTRAAGVSAQREPRSARGELVPFGYAFFEPARQVITARSAFLRRLLAQDVATVPAPQAPGATMEAAAPTDSDLALVAALTDAQKTDLRDRQRAGTLTDAEKAQYRWFLRLTAPGAAVPPAPKGADEPRVDVLAGLTDVEKADIRKRHREQKLSVEDIRRYAPILADDDVAAQAAQAAPAGVTNVEGATLPALQGTRAGGSALPDVDAFRQIADPLATILQRVTPSAPADYQVAAGDVLVVRYWSPTMEPAELRLVVDSGGAIDLPTVGRLVLRGQTTAQAEKALRERMRGFYRDVEVSVQLKELRTMPVVVNGESFFPGTYQVPAVATAFNVLYATGGPTEDGTLRRIEVRRHGVVVASIDLYKFLLTGDAVDDVRLQPGDVLFIAPRMARVAVRGEVRRPALYELADKETLADAVRYAGGINPSGVAQHVQIATVQPGATRVLKEVDWTKQDAGREAVLYDGDSVEVFSVRTQLANKVSVEGAVDQPGEYAIADRMTVADLVERARGLLSEAYTTRADLYRVNPDNTLALVPVELEKALRRDPAANVVLSRWDRLRIYTREEVAWSGRREVTVRGAVQHPGIYTRNENARIKDVLQLAGGTLPDAAEIVVLHRSPDRTYSYDYADVAEVVKENPAQNLLVRDQDVLAIYRKDETRFTPDHTFEVRGEVTAPGSYPRGQGMRLSDALRLAGGLTPKAGTTVRIGSARVDSARAAVEATVSAAGLEPVPNPEINDGDIIAIQGRGTYQDKPWVVTITGQVNKPGPVIVTSGSMRLSEAIQAAGGIKPEAYPQGASFERQPDLLASAGQRQIAAVISALSDLLNQSEYVRALGRAEVERIRMVVAASKGGAQATIPGVSSSSDSGAGTVAAAAASVLPKDRELVSPARSMSNADLMPKGNVAVDLAAALRRPKGDDDIQMADGDVVNVPELPTTIRVGGAVIDGRAVVYRPGQKLEYYIARAGGYAVDAAKDRIMVIRVGGGLMPAARVKALEPGDLILVPTKVLAERFQSHSSEIETFFKGLTTSAIVYKLAETILGF